MRFPFIGGAYGGRSKEMNPQECINLYPVIDKADAKNVTALFGTPGLTERIDIPTLMSEDPAPVRAMMHRDLWMYTVMGNGVYRAQVSSLYIGGTPTLIKLGALSSETNLVPNGDMELNSNWTAYNNGGGSGPTAVGQSGIAYEGSYSWTFTLGGYRDGITSDTFTTVTGTAYRWSARVRVDDGVAVHIRVRNGDDSGWADIGYQVGVIEQAFFYVTGEYVETKGGSGAYIRFEGNYATAETYYIDDVRLYAISGISNNLWLAANNSYLMVVEPGNDGWTYAFGAGAGALAVIADSDFPTPRGACYLDGYFIVTQDGTNKWFISDLNDPTSWDALNYASAESHADPLKACLALQGQVALLSNKAVEFHGHTGASDWPFRRVAVVEQGIGAEGSAVVWDNTIYMLTKQRELVAITNYQARKFSTDSVDYHIQSYDDAEDAIAFMYQQEGHTFYQITFPDSEKTWVYDITTGLFHQRESLNTGGEYARHRAICYEQAGETKYVGDYENGLIYSLDMDAYTDNGEAIRRRRTCPVLHNEQKRIFYHRLEVDFEGGVGLESGDGSDPEATLDWSDDGGNTYGNEHTAKIGAEGDYSQRTMWHRLGSGRNRVFRVTVEEPVKVVMIDAALEASPGGH